MNSYFFPIVFIVSAALVTGCNQQAQAKSESELKQFAQSVIDKMVFVKGGSFMMGDAGYLQNGQHVSWTPYGDVRPAHKVTLDDYSIMKYEVTWGEYDFYKEVMGQIKFKARYIGKYDFRKSNYPAGAKTWADADDFCRWVGKLSNKTVVLPTEAQWEYAARNRGQNIAYATDNGEINVGRNVKSNDTHGDMSTAVGAFPPNPLGIYDMSGNVSEWVSDWYDKAYYSQSPEINPQGPKTGNLKIQKGGSHGDSPEGYDVYVRLEYDKLSGATSTGWRCGVNLSTPK